MNEVAKTRDDWYVTTSTEHVPVTVTLLGPFGINFCGRSAGPWPRPSAKRLCELLMLRPHHRVVKEVVRETLFANLGPEASANALRKAVSMARQALLPMTEGAPILRADRDHICVPPEIPLEIDLVKHEDELRSALAMGPGRPRDAALSAALVQDGVLLDDEPYAEWAMDARAQLDRLRQRARMELARDRAGGYGLSQLEAVVDAWEDCLRHDPASEEAATALMTTYASRGQRQLVARTYRRCQEGLKELGLKPSGAVERVFLSATDGPEQLGALLAYAMPG